MPADSMDTERTTKSDDPQVPAEAAAPGAADEQIEGIDKGSTDWGQYPIDTVLIRNEQRTVYDVVRRIKKGAFVMDPDFQRDFIWDRDKQSKLIESVLMRIPLPVFYLAEDTEGRMIVVDGLQRLSTFQRFLNNELRLKLPGQVDLHEKSFEELSAKLQNRIEDCNLVLYIIDSKVPERARLDIFERVNGGVPLTRQQMRNCLYNGRATRFLKEEASSEIFREATSGSLRSKTMRDREFVNRFCAFQLLGHAQYKGDMDDFLASVLKHMNTMSEADLSALSVEFRTTLQNNYNVFKRHAFRKHVRGRVRRSVLNASLWDIMSTGLARFPESLVLARAEALRSAFYEVQGDADFISSITYSPNSTNMVRYRFATMKRMMAEVFDA